jgi:scyllo-inositol 2-dehydrogenase (NADP+)
MAASRLRVGVIGAGWVAATRHIPSFQSLGSVEVVGILDHNETRAREVAEAAKIPLVTSDPAQFYASGVDVVTIATPPTTHAEVAIEALNRGCHVFIEKPMAMNRDEAMQMTEAAERNSRLLCISHNLLYSRSIRKVKQMIASGQMGEIRQVMGFQLSSPQRRLPTWYAELPGGLFYDESPHLLYLMRYFLEQIQFENVSLNRGATGDGPVESVLAKLRGPKAEGVLSMSFEAPVSEWTLSIVGSKRVVVFDIFRDILTSLRPDGSHSGSDILKNTALSALDFGAGFVTSGYLHSTKKLMYGHEELIRQFVASVRTGRAAPVNGQDGLEVVSLMEQVLAVKPYVMQEAA